MLGAAVMEDIALWGVLALATALAAAGGATGGLADTVSVHVAINLAFVVVAMTVAPAVLRRLGRARWNVMASQTPIAWIMVVLLAYVSLAAALDVTLAFAAFLAGFGIVGGMKNTEHQRFRVPLESISQVSAAVFVPIYFAIVGYRLDFTQGFSLGLLVAFLVGSSLARFASVWLAARCAGFRGLDVVNLAVTANARGGPGIVLASVAFDAGIINAAFFTTLVVTAVATSQVCGAWLDVVLRRGRPLLEGDPAGNPRGARGQSPVPSSAA
jgi:Kef-type K+ transport system membrane component KefB